MKQSIQRRNGRPKLLVKGEYLQLWIRGEWEFVRRNNCHGIVIIIAMTDDGRVIFTDQYRPPVDRHVIEFPAGLVSDEVKNESMLVAAKRELLEETGYKARRMRKILEGPTSSGASSDLVTLVMAEGLRKVGEGGGVEDENIVVHEVPIEKADVWLDGQRRKGKLVDPKIYAGLYFLKKYNGGN